MVAPNSKLSTLTTPGEPQDEDDARSPTPPAKSSGQVTFPVKVMTYNADPIVAAASDILVKEAASKAERTRLESKASSYYSGADESLAHQTKIMIAQRHYSTMALASTVTVPPSPGATSTSGSTISMWMEVLRRVRTFRQLLAFSRKDRGRPSLVLRCICGYGLRRVLRRVSRCRVVRSPYHPLSRFPLHPLKRALTPTAQLHRALLHHSHHATTVVPNPNHQPGSGFH